MKKFTKVCLIIVGVLLGLGLLLAGISAAMGGGYGMLHQMAQSGELDYGNWHISEYGIFYNSEDEAHDYEAAWEFGTEDMEVPNAPESPEAPEISGVAGEDEIVTSYAVEDIREMDIDIGAVQLFFETATDADYVTVTLLNGKNRYYEVGMDGSTLDIEYDVEHHWNTNSNDTCIIVEIPAGMSLDKMDLDIGAADVHFDMTDVICDKLLLDVGAANVIAEEFNVTELIDVSVGAGNVEIYGGSYKDVKIDCGVGNFNMEGTVAGDLTADCGMGNVELNLTGEEDAYNYKLSCGLGSLVVNENTYSSIAGSHNVTNEGAVGTIDLDCGMGNIEVNIR